MTKEKQVLKNVHDLLRKKNSWVRGRPAVTVNGQGCSPSSDKATAWCLAGAIAKFDPEVKIRVTMRNKRAVYKSLLDIKNFDTVESFNDRVIHAELMKRLENAIS